MMALKIVGFALVIAFLVGVIGSNPTHVPIRYYGLELAYEPTLAETMIFSFLLGMLVATVAFMLDKARVTNKAKRLDIALQNAQEEIARLRLKVISTSDTGSIEGGSEKPTPPPTTGKKTRNNATPPPPPPPTINSTVPSTSPATESSEPKADSNPIQGDQSPNHPPPPPPPFQS